MSAGVIKHPRTGVEYIEVRLLDEWFGRKPTWTDEDGNVHETILPIVRLEAERLIKAGRAEAVEEPKKKPGRKPKAKQAQAPQNKMVKAAANK